MHGAKQTKILEFKVKKGLWQGPSKKDEWLVLKRPNFSMVFREVILKATFEVMASGCTFLTG